MNRLKKTNKKIKGTKKRTKINWVERKLPESIAETKLPERWKENVEFMYDIPSTEFYFSMIVPAKYSMKDFLKILEYISIDNRFGFHTDDIAQILMKTNLPTNFILPKGEDIAVYVREQGGIPNYFSSRVSDFKPYIYLIDDIYAHLTVLNHYITKKLDWSPSIVQYKYHYASAYIDDNLDRLLVHPEFFNYPFKNIMACEKPIIEDGDIEIHHDYQPSSYQHYYNEEYPRPFTNKMVIYKPPPFEYLTKSL